MPMSNCSTTPMWIVFCGVLGRIFISPAHHQAHHSADPKHFKTTFDSCLALRDWMFGTLYVPQKEREPLIFGVAEHAEGHTVKAELADLSSSPPAISRRCCRSAQPTLRQLPLRSATAHS